MGNPNFLKAGGYTGRSFNFLVDCQRLSEMMEGIFKAPLMSVQTSDVVERLSNSTSVPNLSTNLQRFLKAAQSLPILASISMDGSNAIQRPSDSPPVTDLSVNL
jgi:hypothetical protein